MEPNVIPWDQFVAFSKIARLNREMVITEKIDGTNACVSIREDGGAILAGSRNRWLTWPTQDNFGFAKWVQDNREELLKLGPGRHYGEWWGVGIQRGYGLSERRFSLFNPKWNDNAIRPKCCSVVPILCVGLFDSYQIRETLRRLGWNGSYAAPGFM